MKINQIIVETTTSGAVASVAQPLGGVQKRSGNKKAGSMFKGKTTNKPFYEDQVNEEDKIIAPGKGHKVKPGLLNKPEVSMNPTDTVKLDVPLLIRLLEYAREDAGNDLDLHDLAEKLVARGSRGKTLSMKDYEYVVDEGFGGALAGGVIGAALTKSPSGAMTGAKVGSQIQNALTKESGGVIAGGGVGEGLNEFQDVGNKFGYGDEDEQDGIDQFVDHLSKLLAPQGFVQGMMDNNFENHHHKVSVNVEEEPGNAFAAVVTVNKLDWAPLPRTSRYPGPMVNGKPSELKPVASKTFTVDLSSDLAMSSAFKKVVALIKQASTKPDGVKEGAKVDRMVKHIAKSERGLGHSKKEAENIAWATANKRGYLDNKNKKK